MCQSNDFSMVALARTSPIQLNYYFSGGTSISLTTESSSWNLIRSVIYNATENGLTTKPRVCLSVNTVNNIESHFGFTRVLQCFINLVFFIGCILSSDIFAFFVVFFFSHIFSSVSAAKSPTPHCRARMPHIMPCTEMHPPCSPGRAENAANSI